VLKLSNGDLFEGIWSLDERCGFGIMKFSSGEEYKGDWQSNKFHGGIIFRFTSSPSLPCLRTQLYFQAEAL
jgi:hypothetical protein